MTWFLIPWNEEVGTMEETEMSDPRNHVSSSLTASEIHLDIEKEIRRQLEDDPRFKDNEIAHEVVNKCLETIGARLTHIEEYVQALPQTFTNLILYRPHDDEKYLNYKENLDLIYERLNSLEEFTNID